jgi:hypothetical protein
MKEARGSRQEYDNEAEDRGEEAKVARFRRCFVHKCLRVAVTRFYRTDVSIDRWRVFYVGDEGAYGVSDV